MDRRFPLVLKPIVISDEVWLAAETFVAPGVNVGMGVVVGARSSVFTDLPELSVCMGSPAKVVSYRK